MSICQHICLSVCHLSVCLSLSWEPTINSAMYVLVFTSSSVFWVFSTTHYLLYQCTYPPMHGCKHKLALAHILPEWAKYSTGWGKSCPQSCMVAYSMCHFYLKPETYTALKLAQRGITRCVLDTPTINWNVEVWTRPHISSEHLDLLLWRQGCQVKVGLWLVLQHVTDTLCVLLHVHFTGTQSSTDVCLASA